MPNDAQPTCKVVDLIDVSPVRFNDDDGGVIISYWHVGKPELPLVLNSSDSKELMIRILRCLAHQNDEQAQTIIENYF